jgi:hypothetical protein
VPANERPPRDGIIACVHLAGRPYEPHMLEWRDVVVEPPKQPMPASDGRLLVGEVSSKGAKELIYPKKPLKPLIRRPQASLSIDGAPFCLALNGQ